MLHADATVKHDATADNVRIWLPWVVAIALFMETLDATIVNTAVPVMADSLGTNPFSLKAVVASYIVSVAIGIPVSGWMADRYGTRRVFFAAVALFTVASILCGLAVSLHMLVAARVLQGFAAAMMMPIGRIAILKAFPKRDLLRAINFVTIPALIGPLLGPTVGGLIVHWLSWRVIFFVNIPVGLAALWLIHSHMPDYRRGDTPPLDVRGFLLFGTGLALVSWLLEVFGEHTLTLGQGLGVLAVAFLCLGAYALHTLSSVNPLLNLALFRVRTFRIAVIGGFITRWGIGGMPFLTPLFYQAGLGFPAWQSGLMIMPTALAAMTMKGLSLVILQRLGYRQVLIVNTLLSGAAISAYALVSRDTPVVMILVLSFTLGLFNSLQFSAMNSMGYADIDERDASAASTISSSMQQLSMSFGLASGSIAAAWFLAGVSPKDTAAATTAIQHAFLVLGGTTALSSLSFWTLRPNDGLAVSGGAEREPSAVPQDARATSA